LIRVRWLSIRVAGPAKGRAEAWFRAALSPSTPPAGDHYYRGEGGTWERSHAADGTRWGEARLGGKAGGQASGTGLDPQT